jgi:hypothetical protein
LLIESVDLELPDEANAWFGVGKREQFPISSDAAPHCRDFLVGGMTGIEKLLASRQGFTLGAKRFGRLVLLFGRKGLANAHPGEAYPHGRGGFSEPLRGRDGRTLIGTIQQGRHEKSPGTEVDWLD